jgi:hypothetical protein
MRRDDTSSAIRLRRAHRGAYGSRRDDLAPRDADEITRPLDTRPPAQAGIAPAEPIPECEGPMVRPRTLAADETRRIEIRRDSRSQRRTHAHARALDDPRSLDTDRDPRSDGRTHAHRRALDDPRSLDTDRHPRSDADDTQRTHLPPEGCSDGEQVVVARLKLAKVVALFGKIGALVAIMLGGACLGEFPQPMMPGPGGGGDGPVTLPDGTVVGGRSLRRLTPSEYDATVRDAFALGDAWPGAGLSPDASSALGFDNDVSLMSIDEARSAELVAAAEKIADLVLSQKIAPCSTRACAEMIVDQYAPRLFRRAITADDRQRYLAAWDELAKLSSKDALKWTLVALLSSPHFLYRFELGERTADGTYRLGGEELASAIAYSFSGGPPSSELLDKGQRGELANADARVAEARKLLESSRGHAVVDRFMRKWLHYSDVRTLVKDAAVVAGFPSLREDMAEETRRFIDDVVYARKGRLADLFTSADTFVTPALAAHYGLPAPSAPFARVSRPPEQALGLLAQGSLLSRFALTHSSSPPQRGAFVRRHVLCQELPPPPPNAGTPPLPQPGMTTRELYEKLHSAQAACAGCHKKIDPIGFGLEAFDTAGRWRTSESGKPIDPSGLIASLGTQGDVPFSDARGLAQLLAQSKEVAQCVGGLMSVWTFGSAGAQSYSTRSTLGDTPLEDYLAGLAAAPHFTTRASNSSCRPGSRPPRARRARGPHRRNDA